MKTLRSRGLTPGGFLVLAIGTHPFISKAVVCLLLSPLFFIVLKLFSVQLITEKTADAIAAKLAGLWPAMRAHYLYLLQRGSELDASNYAVFALWMFVLTFSLVVATIVFYVRTVRQPKGFTYHDAYIWLISLVLAWFALYADMPGDPPKWLLSFQIDRAGFYYLRQWMLIANAAISLILTAGTAMTVLSYIAGKVGIVRLYSD